jgi:adenylosuccinate lyase
MMGLAPHTGRNEAHDLVYDACRVAIETDRPLLDVLLEIPAVATPLGPDKLRALTDPANYLGAAPRHDRPPPRPPLSPHARAYSKARARFTPSEIATS